LDEKSVRDGGMKFEAVYVCGKDGEQRRVLKKVDVGAGVENISAQGFEVGGKLVAVIMEGQG